MLQLVGEKHAFALKSGLNVVAVIGDRAEERQDNWARGWIGERDGGEDAWSTQVLYRQLQVIAGEGNTLFCNIFNDKTTNTGDILIKMYFSNSVINIFCHFISYGV